MCVSFRAQIPDLFIACQKYQEALSYINKTVSDRAKQSCSVAFTMSRLLLDFLRFPDRRDKFDAQSYSKQELAPSFDAVRTAPLAIDILAGRIAMPDLPIPQAFPSTLRTPSITLSQ